MLSCALGRNHERNWPGLSDRASVNKSTDSGGEGGIIYDKRMGLGMPIVPRAPLFAPCIAVAYQLSSLTYCALVVRL